MKKQLLLLFKILLGIACFAFLWYRLRNQFTAEKTEHLQTVLGERNSILLLCLAFVLVIPNWLIESYKWKKITEDIEHISMRQAISGVLAGVCIGNLTPGRFGEFAGRIIYFSPHNRSKATVTHFVCGASQLFMTLFFGLIAGGLWVLHTDQATGFYYIVLLICFMLFGVLFYLLLNAEKAYSWLSKRNILKRFNLGTVHYKRNTLLQLVLWSALRYLVFSSQYILLLQYCGIKATYLQLFIPVAISFMLMSSLPMISFIEVAIRAGIAVLLFSSLEGNELLIVTASTLLWFINIALPSVAGYFVILVTKIRLKENQQTIS